MPKLLKNVEGKIFDSYTTNVTYVSSVTGEVQQEDYINLGGFVAYLQNLTEVQVTSRLTKPTTLGLKNTRNLQVVTLNIDY